MAAPARIPVTEREWAELSVQTIGHSNHPMEHFLDLLRQHAVGVVVDVRSSPYSKYAKQFDKEPLVAALRDGGFQYLYMGAELGGRPRGNEFYDAEGHVLYGKVAESRTFDAGLARLKKGLQRHSVALMCAEENPAECHRRLLITRVLVERGATVEHIRGDGRLENEQQLRDREADDQLRLFAEMETTTWKSIPSVSPKKRQSSSSVF